MYKKATVSTNCGFFDKDFNDKTKYVFQYLIQS